MTTKQFYVQGKEVIHCATVKQSIMLAESLW